MLWNTDNVLHLHFHDDTEFDSWSKRKKERIVIDSFSCSISITQMQEIYNDCSQLFEILTISELVPRFHTISLIFYFIILIFQVFVLVFWNNERNEELEVVLTDSENPPEWKFWNFSLFLGKTKISSIEWLTMVRFWLQGIWWRDQNIDNQIFIFFFFSFIINLFGQEEEKRNEIITWIPTFPQLHFLRAIVAMFCWCWFHYQHRGPFQAGHLLQLQLPISWDFGRLVHQNFPFFSPSPFHFPPKGAKYFEESKLTKSEWMNDTNRSLQIESIFAKERKEKKRKEKKRKEKKNLFATAASQRWNFLEEYFGANGFGLRKINLIQVNSCNVNSRKINKMKKRKEQKK